MLYDFISLEKDLDNLTKEKSLKPSSIQFLRTLNHAAMANYAHHKKQIETEGLTAAVEDRLGITVGTADINQLSYQNLVKDLK